jgi:hypothetical protein
VNETTKWCKKDFQSRVNRASKMHIPFAISAPVESRSGQERYPCLKFSIGQQKCATVSAPETAEISKNEFFESIIGIRASKEKSKTRGRDSHGRISTFALQKPGQNPF